MSALWIHEIVDRFWADAGAIPTRYPRDLLQDAFWAVPVSHEALPALSISGVNAWLAERGMDLRLAVPDRRLRACILAHEDAALLFVDASDPEDERRFSVAHEIAHYLVEYALPRREACQRLGTGILPVLGGQRPPSTDERIGALLAGVSLRVCLHLMERTPSGHLPGQHTSTAERHADDLAFELLAPFEAVRAHHSLASSQAELAGALCERFGLPAGPAWTYAERLAPAPPAGSAFRRLFSVS